MLGSHNEVLIHYLGLYLASQQTRNYQKMRISLPDIARIPLRFFCGLLKIAAGTIILSFLCCIVSYRIGAQQLQYRQFSTSDGLPSNSVYASLQDLNGDIWFATEFGLSRYNGFTFENFNRSHGLPDSEILKIFQDSQGRIWMALTSGELCFLKDGKIHHSKNNPILRALKVGSFFNGFLEDGDGSIWFTSLDHGIFCLRRDGKVSQLKPLVNLAASFVSPGIWKDASGEIRVCSDKGVLNLSRNPGIPELSFPPGGEEIRYSGRLRDGRVLMGTGNSLLVWQPPDSALFTIGSAQGYNDNLVTNIAESPEGNLWISSINGLHFFRKGILNTGSHRVFFQGKTISGFHFDRQGNLWLTTLNEGVFLVSGLEALWYNKTSGIPEIPVTAIFHDQRQLYWGNDRGEAGTLFKDSVRHLSIPSVIQPFGRGRVREFQSRPGNPGEIWSVTENALLILRNGILVGVFPAPSKSIDFQNEMVCVGTARNCRLIDTEILSAMGEQILAECRKKKKDLTEILKKYRLIWKNIRYILPQNRVYKVRRDAGGMVWMACQTGLYSMQYDKILYHVENNPDFGLPFQNLAILGNGTIALGSIGRGVLLLDETGKTKWFGTSQGLSSSYIRNLRPQGKDSLWICTDDGVNLLKVKGPERDFVLQSWTKNNSTLIPGDVWDLAVCRDTLWLACASGIQCIPSLRLLHQINPALPEIELVTVNGKLQIQDNHSIRAARGELVCIRFRNPDYRTSGKAAFQYRLLPDSQWRDLSGSTILEKIRIAGVYSLQLRAINSQKEITQGGSLLQIYAGSNFERFSERTKFDMQSILLLFIPVLLLSTAYFVYFFRPRFFAESRGGPMASQLLSELHIALITRSDFHSEAGNCLLKLRKQLADCGSIFPLACEAELCRSYFSLLQLYDGQARFSLELSDEEAQTRINTHSVFEWLLNQLRPAETEGKTHDCFLSLVPGGMKFLLIKRKTEFLAQEEEQIEKIFLSQAGRRESSVFFP